MTILIASIALAQGAEEPAFDEAAKAMEKYKTASGLKLEVFAAEPQLVNPVALWMDDRGRAWVVETYRFEGGGEGHGVYDIRHRYHQLDDDLAMKMVEQRLETLLKWNNGDLSSLTEWPDRLRMIVDTDGDGRADHATVFAEFKEPLDGIASGVITRGDDVYLANIPHLWLLRDTDGDGVADVRESLSYGYGVRYSFLGHDLHGLRWGPDGKLYFSMGDRGLHVETREGKAIALPDEGAVLRCDPDGSNLEVFARGLRNPQKLAFDQYGNLFTGDNNCDHGDPARWVHLVEGGDSGWRIGYQHIRTPRPTGPWLREKLFALAAESTAAYVIPPVAHIAAGPSGCTYYPGTGLPEKYNEHFFLTDFRAGPASVIHSFAMKPRGASFELVNRGKLVEQMVATDIEFGPDGGAYITDWPSSFVKPNKGRIYRLFHPEISQSELVLETKRLINEGMQSRANAEVAQLLGHVDMRVRQAAQFELANRGQASVALLNQAVVTNENRMARIHAIWALGQIHRKHPDALDAILPLLSDGDEEIRAQAAKVLGEGRVVAAGQRLIELLRDESARVRHFAAMALGKIEQRNAVAPILEMLAANNNEDAVLRHAGAMGLAWIGDVDALVAAAKHESAAARMGAVLALRHLERPEIAAFLHDADQAVVAEAARAINDVPVAAAYEKLAPLLANETRPEVITHRALNANLRIGTANEARAVSEFAVKSAAEEAMRIEALAMLGEWDEPRGIDRVVGNWLPYGPREKGVAAAVSRAAIAAIVVDAPDNVRVAAITLAEKVGTDDPDLLVKLATSEPISPPVGAAALKALETARHPRLDEAVQASLKIGRGAHRTEAIRLLAHRADATAQLEALLAESAIPDQQAVLTALGTIHNDAANAVLMQWMDKLLGGGVAPELQLDLLAAAAESKSDALKAKVKEFDDRRDKNDHLAAHRETLFGGDAVAGRRIFFERAEVSCLRCHMINGEGGVVGPDLTGIGGKRDRVHLLESLVDPNREITPGYESANVKLKAGKAYSGVVKSEDDATLVLDAGDGAIIHIAKTEIDARNAALSPMPTNIVEPLSRRDLRDLVEYLASLKD